MAKAQHQQQAKKQAEQTPGGLQRAEEQAPLETALETVPEVSLSPPGRLADSQPRPNVSPKSILGWQRLVGNRVVQRYIPGPQPERQDDPFSMFWNDFRLQELINDPRRRARDVYDYLLELADLRAMTRAIRELQFMHSLYTPEHTDHQNDIKIVEVLNGVAMSGSVSSPYEWQIQGLGERIQNARYSVEDAATFALALAEGDRNLARTELYQARRVYRPQSVAAGAPAVASERAALVLDRMLGQVAQSQAPGTTAPEGGYGASPPAELLAGTTTPTTQQREQLYEAMVPPTAAQQSGGQTTFNPEVGGRQYGDRIRERLEAWIQRGVDTLVTGRGEQEHQTNVHPMQRFEEIAGASKDAVDEVFGSYARGPAFVAGTNLRDHFEELGREQAAMSGQQKREAARNLLQYAMESDRQIRAINQEHNAQPERRQESRIISPIIRDLGNQHRDQLLAIDRGWPGIQDPEHGRVEIQRFRRDTPREDRHFMWYSFGMLMHEYVHSLGHDAYNRYAQSLDGRRYNTMIEGMTSVLTDVAWSNTEGRLQEQGLRNRVEGPDYSGQPFDRTVIPNHPNRYASFEEALNVFNLVGPRNVYAAYFLGQTELVRGEQPSGSGSGSGSRAGTEEAGGDRWQLE